jgi:hypothetical protein
MKPIVTNPLSSSHLSPCLLKFKKFYFKVFLNGLKQEAYNGYSTWDVCDGNMIKFNHSFLATQIPSTVT